MAHYKISATFLNSFLQDAKWHGFTSMLLKKYEPSKWTEWGCYFEDRLDEYYHMLEKIFTLPEYEHENPEFVNYVRNGRDLLTQEIFDRWCADIGGNTIWQEWQRKDMVVGDDIFTIIGKPDIYSREQGRIIDLKTAHRSPKRDKFDDSIQHAMYIWMTGIEHFDYKILSREAPAQIFTRSYGMDVEIAEEKIHKAITGAMNHLNENPSLKKLFDLNFTLKPDAAVFRH